LKGLARKRRVSAIGGKLLSGMTKRGIVTMATFNDNQVNETIKNYCKKCIMGVSEKKYVVFYCKDSFYTFIILLSNNNTSKDIFSFKYR